MKESTVIAMRSALSALLTRVDSVSAVPIALLNEELSSAQKSHVDAWMANTGIAGTSDGCDRPFWLKSDAVNYVKLHGGYVYPMVRETADFIFDWDNPDGPEAA